MKCKYGDFYTESTLYMYSIRKVIMYNCHLAWWSGAIQSMLFSNIYWQVLLIPHGERRGLKLQNIFNGDSGIFLFESIEESSKKQGKTSNQMSDHQTNQSGRSKQKHTWYTTRRAWRHTFTKSDRRLKGPSTDVNDCWPFHNIRQQRSSKFGQR